MTISHIDPETNEPIYKDPYDRARERETRRANRRQKRSGGSKDASETESDEE
ncbi:MAG: hypothetical protein HUJ65_02445 [Oscillospiraceae bacterium]|nr:hypothetical protein [Oscillospiraceae bacterium]